jgi:hypothetical protein
MARDNIFLSIARVYLLGRPSFEKTLFREFIHSAVRAEQLAVPAAIEVKVAWLKIL